MIENKKDFWVCKADGKKKAFLSAYGEGYKLVPLKGRTRYYKTFNRAMKALKKYEEVK